MKCEEFSGTEVLKTLKDLENDKIFGYRVKKNYKNDACSRFLETTYYAC